MFFSPLFHVFSFLKFSSSSGLDLFHSFFEREKKEGGEVSSFLKDFRFRFFLSSSFGQFLVRILHPTTLPRSLFHSIFCQLWILLTNRTFVDAIVQIPKFLFFANFWGHCNPMPFLILFFQDLEKCRHDPLYDGQISIASYCPTLIHTVPAATSSNIDDGPIA